MSSIIDKPSSITIPNLLTVATGVGVGYCAWKYIISDIWKAKRMTEEDLRLALIYNRKHCYHLQFSYYIVAKELFNNSMAQGNMIRLDSQEQIAEFGALVDDKTAEIYDECNEIMEKHNGLSMGALLKAIGTAIEKHPEWQNQAATDPESLAYLVQSYFQVSGSVRQMIPPCPNEEVSHPLLSRKEAERMFLNFFVDAIRDWIDFVKDNVFNLRVHLDIKKAYVKKFYKTVGGESMTKAFIAHIGGEEAAKDLEFHPIMYIFGTLGFESFQDREFAELTHKMMNYYYSVQTTAHKIDCSNMLPGYYKALDEVKSDMKKYLMSKYPEDYKTEEEPVKEPEAEQEVETPAVVEENAEVTEETPAEPVENAEETPVEPVVEEEPVVQEEPVEVEQESDEKLEEPVITPEQEE